MFKSSLSVMVLLVVGTSCCPQQYPLRYGNQWEQCVTGEFCRSRQLVIYGSTCIRTCPHGTYYFEDTRTCYDVCPSDTVSKEDRCLNGSFCLAQYNQVLFNGSCLHSCPDSASFTMYGTCYDSCSQDTVANGSECIFQSECITRGNFIFNNTCVEECPKEGRREFLGRCYRTCPANSFMGRNETCLSKDECVSKHNGVIFNNTCTNGCPPEAKFDSSGVCYAKCPTQTFADGVQCLTETACIHRAMVIHENQCIKTCPQEAQYIVDHRCYSKCPQGSVLYNESCISVVQCVSVSWLYHVIYNESCVDSCPAAAPITRNGICVESCPSGTIVSDRQCIDPHHCTDRHMVIYNNSCASNCPDEAPYIFNSICHKECSKGYVVSGRECVKVNDCKRIKKVIYNNTCVSSCPEEDPFLLDNVCHEVCPQNTIRLENSSHCMTPGECKSKGKYVANTTCVEECPPFLPYHLHHVCCLECPANSNIFAGHKCVYASDCKGIQNAVLYNGSCLPSCPRHAPNKKGTNCYSKCPSGYVSKDFVCIDKYECNAIIFSGQCLPSCPDKAPYLKLDTCYTTCPGDMLGFNRSKCMYDYECKEQHMFVYNGSCIPKCLPGTIPFANILCYSLFEVKIGMIIFSSIILLMMLFLFPCIYNPKKSRQMNAPKIWKQTEETQNDVLEGEYNDSFSLHEAETQPKDDDCSTTGNIADHARIDEIVIPGPSGASTNTQDIELNSILVHHDQDSDDEPLLSVVAGEHQEDYDDALLFGSGDS